MKEDEAVKCEKCTEFQQATINDNSPSGGGPGVDNRIKVIGLGMWSCTKCGAPMPEELRKQLPPGV